MNNKRGLDKIRVQPLMNNRDVGTQITVCGTPVLIGLNEKYLCETPIKDG